MSGLFSLDGRVALVTGGSRGIGLMIARGFVQAGAKTYIVGRDRDACEGSAAELGRDGSCIALPGDVSDLAGIDALSSALKQQETSLDILVNNAGALSDAPLDEVTAETWDAVVDLNLKAAFFLTQRLLPLLRAAATPESHASVINIGSTGGLRVSDRETYAYAASKAGLHHLTRSLARRLGREAITVNAIAPGFFPSALTAEVSDPAVLAAVVAGIPLGRMGQPDEAAGTAIFLASRAGAYVSGAVIPLDGAKSV